MRATLLTAAVFLTAVCAAGCDLPSLKPTNCPAAMDACMFAVDKLAKEAGQPLDPRIASAVCEAAMMAAEEAQRGAQK